MLIRPAHFAFNTQTADSNSFQQHPDDDETNIAENALNEFDNFAGTLRARGVNVFVFEDTGHPIKPDAIFPNNWLSIHQDGTLVLYPMCAPNRRTERRQDIIDAIKQRFNISNTIDLSHFEDEDIFLEGTGSIVFDHDNRTAYASISPRTNKDLFLNLSEQLGYKPICFHAHDIAGQEVYHTNVIMSVGEHFCVLCTECIDNNNQRELVRGSLTTTGHEIVEISNEQMNSFAGNMLPVNTNNTEPLLILSQTAFDSLTVTQKQTLSKYAELLPIPITTIESIGGGSARCMMAEIFAGSLNRP